MAEIISASQAREDSRNAGKAEEKNAVAKTIEKATEKGLYAVTIAKLSDDIVAQLRKAGYVVGKRTTGFDVSWDYEGPEYEEAESVQDIKDLIENGEKEVFVELKEDVNLSKDDYIEVPAGKKVTVKVDGNMTIGQTGFAVADGGTLNLVGEGTINTTNKSTSGAIVEANGKTALVNIDGVTLDCTTQGKQGNYAYGVYLRNDASVNFKSGTIKCAYGSCISTNNTTGSATVINVTGGELLCDGSYAIYSPSQNTVNISGGTVQGINARLGKFNISGDAKIIGTTLTEADYDNIGKEFKTSGCVWLGDTIAVMAGTYTDPNGNDCEFTIDEDVTVESSFRAAVGVYEVDLKEAQKVRVNVAKGASVKTTAEGFNAYMVYDHDYIATEAQKAGKVFEPTVQSEVVINAKGKQIYP